MTGDAVWTAKSRYRPKKNDWISHNAGRKWMIDLAKFPAGQRNSQNDGWKKNRTSHNDAEVEWTEKPNRRPNSQYRPKSNDRPGQEYGRKRMIGPVTKTPKRSDRSSKDTDRKGITGQVTITAEKEWTDQSQWKPKRNDRPRQVTGRKEMISPVTMMTEEEWPDR